MSLQEGVSTLSSDLVAFLQNLPAGSLSTGIQDREKVKDVPSHIPSETRRPTHGNEHVFSIKVLLLEVKGSHVRMNGSTALGLDGP